MELVKNTVYQYKELLSDTSEYQESIDVIVPDVNPDVMEIVSASASCNAREKSLQQDRLTVSGEIEVCVFYRAEQQEKLYSVIGKIPFSHSCDAKGAVAADMALITAEVLSASATMLNPRKLTLKAMLGVHSSVYQNQGVSVTENAAGLPEEGINCLIGSEERLLLSTITEKKIVFAEEIRLSAAAEPAELLLHAHATWNTEDIKVLTNKIMLRGSAALQVITASAAGDNVEEHTYHLPFAQVIECDAADVHDQVTVRYQPGQLQAQLMQREDGAVFLKCSASATAAAIVYKKTQLQVLQDLYSTVYATECQTEALPLAGVWKERTAEKQCSETAEPDSPAVRVCSWQLRCSSRCSGGNTAQGSFYFMIWYETVAGKVRQLCRRVNVEMPLETEGAVRAEARQVSVTVDSIGNLQMDFCAVFTVCAAQQTTCRQISTCTLDKKNRRKPQRQASLILRAVEAGESAWSLAKQYGTTQQAVLVANRLADGEELMPGRLAIIPFN